MWASVRRPHQLDVLRRALAGIRPDQIWRVAVTHNQLGKPELQCHLLVALRYPRHPGGRALIRRDDLQAESDLGRVEGAKPLLSVAVRVVEAVELRLVVAAALGALHHPLPEGAVRTIARGHGVGQSARGGGRGVFHLQTVCMIEFPACRTNNTMSVSQCTQHTEDIHVCAGGKDTAS